MIFSSANAIGENVDLQFSKTINISAQTIANQFFFISSIPLNIIYDLFSDAQQRGLSNAKKSDNSNKKDNIPVAKASFGYAVFVNNILNFKAPSKEIKYGDGKDKNFICVNSRCLNVFYPDKILASASENSAHIFVFLMLLLAIIITRRNIGEEIIRKIKYKIQPGFVF